MESARFSIDSDQKFYLEHLPTLDGLLKAGITLFVDKDFKKYHDMTLTQYAIAKRKPNTLRFLLKKLKDLKIEDCDILLPKTSNTRSGLLKLAVEFGSKGFYDNVDNNCLNIIIEEFRNTIENESKYTEAPLTLAIEKKNEEAVKTLLDNHANFFSPLKEISTNFDVKESEDNKDKTVIEPFKALSMPITCIFKNNNDKGQLEHIYNTVLFDHRDIIFKQINNIQVENQSYADFLGNEYKLLEAKEFINEQIDNIREAINSIDKGTNLDEPKPSQKTQKDKKPKQKLVCHSCHKEQTNGEQFEKVPGTDFYLCANCKS